MWIYILIFIITLIFHFVFAQNGKPPYAIFFIYCVGLGTFIGLSDMLGGYDRYIYGEVFDYYSGLINNGESMLNNSFFVYFKSEPGYGLINYAIAQFTVNRYIFILSFTIIAYCLFAVALYRNTRHPFFALIIFFGLSFFFTFTYLRQIMAMAICWNTIQLIEKRRLIPFLLVVLFAATIHNASILFFVLYFIPNKNYSKQSIVIVMSILLILGIIGPASTLYEIYGATSGAVEKAASYQRTSEYGFRVEYLIESVLFLVILLVNYDKILFTKKNSVLVNSYLMFCATLLLFVKSSDGGRMAWMSVIGVISVLSMLCTQENRNLLKPTVIAICIMLYVRVLISWGMTLYPYKTFLTPGYREGDLTHQNYEYDHRYDIDKLYK